MDSVNIHIHTVVVALTFSQWLQFLLNSMIIDKIFVMGILKISTRNNGTVFHLNLHMANVTFS